MSLFLVLWGIFNLQGKNFMEITKHFTHSGCAMLNVYKNIYINALYLMYALLSGSTQGIPEPPNEKYCPCPVSRSRTVLQEHLVFARVLTGGY